jgi:hypothetical protein
MRSSYLPSLIVLGLAALGALLLVLRRRSPPERAADRSAAAWVLAASVGIQGVHFGEEVATGFHERLPALFELPGIPITAFVLFNMTWLGIWVVSVPRLRSGRADAFFAAWFLAIAGMLNGIAHPLLAVAAGGYFPGLVSSPFIGAMCVWLWIRLRRATRPG